jgi:nucleoside-diphosphate-sugar epimerase
MKVLITGGAGILGRKLAELFLKSGDQARVFDLPQVDYSYFDDKEGIEIVKGDIRDKDTVKTAVAGVDAILHLAALIPPASERDRQFTMTINAGGTGNLLEAAQGTASHFILTSSVATYGDTTRDDPPVRVSHSQTALDFYAESKIESERLTKASGLSYTIFRIAPIAVPEIMDPPDVWPYKAEQRVEFINRDDVANALFACAYASGAKGKTLNIAGGKSWQVSGREYVTALYEAMELEPSGAVFSDTPGWFDWYDTEESEALLKYQKTPFPEFVAQLRKAAEEAFGW